ncbi:hypothetical protein AOLI_G00119830 [Acnodon oligacanthus]
MISLPTEDLCALLHAAVPEVFFSTGGINDPANPMNVNLRKSTTSAKLTDRPDVHVIWILGERAMRQDRIFQAGGLEGKSSSFCQLDLMSQVLLEHVLPPSSGLETTEYEYKAAAERTVLVFHQGSKTCL